MDFPLNDAETSGYQYGKKQKNASALYHMQIYSGEIANLNIKKKKML